MEVARQGNAQAQMCRVAGITPPRRHSIPGTAGGSYYAAARAQAGSTAYSQLLRHRDGTYSQFSRVISPVISRGGNNLGDGIVPRAGGVAGRHGGATSSSS